MMCRSSRGSWECKPRTMLLRVALVFACFGSGSASTIVKMQSSASLRLFHVSSRRFCARFSTKKLH